MTEKKYVQLKKPKSKDTENSSKIADIYSRYQSLILASIFGIPVTILFVVPLISGQVAGTAFYFNSVTIALLFAAMALTLNVEAGYLGLPNFGKVAFIAVGGYSFAMTAISLTGKMDYGLVVIISFIVAWIITGLFGVLLTLPTLKLREDYLAIVTIVAGEIVRNIVNNQQEFGGVDGFTVQSPIYLQYDSTLFMGGKFINALNLTLILVILGISYYSYYQFMSKKIEHLPEDRQQIQAIRRAITTLILLSAVLIFLNYGKILSNNALFGLDKILLINIGILLIFQELKLHEKSIKFEYVYILVALISLIDFIRGLNATVSETEIKYVVWYTFLLVLFALLFTFVISEELYYSPFGRT